MFCVLVHTYINEKLPCGTLLNGFESAEEAQLWCETYEIADKCFVGIFQRLSGDTKFPDKPQYLN